MAAGVGYMSARPEKNSPRKSAFSRFEYRSNVAQGSQGILVKASDFDQQQREFYDQQLERVLQRKSQEPREENHPFTEQEAGQQARQVFAQVAGNEHIAPGGSCQALQIASAQMRTATVAFLGDLLKTRTTDAVIAARLRTATQGALKVAEMDELVGGEFPEDRRRIMELQAREAVEQMKPEEAARNYRTLVASGGAAQRFYEVSKELRGEGQEPPLSDVEDYALRNMQAMMEVTLTALALRGGVAGVSKDLHDLQSWGCTEHPAGGALQSAARRVWKPKAVAAFKAELTTYVRNLTLAERASFSMGSYRSSSEDPT